MSRTSPNKFSILALMTLLAVFLLAGLFLGLQKPEPVQAANVVSAPAPQGGGPTNDVCLACHSRPGQTVDLPSGEKLDISVDAQVFMDSMHGSEGLSCTQCHTNITGFPHPALTANSRKDYSLQYQQTCKNCHQEQFQANEDSVHARALASENLQAPTCSNCHDPHSQQKLVDANQKLLPEARKWVADTCAQCHSAIYDEYKDSVHGQGVVEGNNPDVPTCTDCHGVHSIGDPTTAQFRINSPKMCSDCHTNAAIMDKYGISTEVMSTYVADFHGTTVTLFQKQHPDQETNKPVCFDCHGVHNIAKIDDPEKGLKVKENILAACQKCHPDANTNFPDSWLSHYIPSPTHAPLVYYVNLFYQILIPLVLGVMVIYVLSDVYRRFIRKGKGKPSGDGDDQQSA